MESNLKGTVNYLQFVDCSLDAAKQSEKLQDGPPQQPEEAYFGLLIDQYIKIAIKDD